MAELGRVFFERRKLKCFQHNLHPYLGLLLFSHWSLFMLINVKDTFDTVIVLSTSCPCYHFVWTQ